MEGYNNNKEDKRGFTAGRREAVATEKRTRGYNFAILTHE